MNLTRVIYSLAICVLGATYLQAQPASVKPNTVSVLGNTVCTDNTGEGGGSSCYIHKVGTNGFVRCTCTANCLSPCSMTRTVASTRGIHWGENTPCATALSGYAMGGTAYGNSPGTYSAVWTQYLVTGIFLGAPAQSDQIVDCFNGTIRSDPVAGGIC